MSSLGCASLNSYWYYTLRTLSLHPGHIASPKSKWFNPQSEFKSWQADLTSQWNIWRDNLLQLSRAAITKLYDICRDKVLCGLISFRAEVAVMAAQWAGKHLLWWAGGWFTAVQRATFVLTSPAVSFRRTARRHYHTDALRKLHQPVQFPLPGRTCSAVAIIRQYVCCHPECDVLYQPHFWDSLAMQLFRFSSLLELVGKEEKEMLETSYPNWLPSVIDLTTKSNALEFSPKIFSKSWAPKTRKGRKSSPHI